ncbi:MAG: NFACT family protein [Blastocatellia bacterium]|nr:NFACT family protein [Blastocatellia bacterium]
MENFYLSAIVREMAAELIGRAVSRVSLHGADLLIDFHLPDDRALLASLDPAGPALYLADRPRKQGDVSHAFVSQLRKKIVGAKLINIFKHPSDRIARLDFERFDAAGDKAKNSLILALTGRSSNAYLLGSDETIEALLKDRGASSVGDRLDLNESDSDAALLLEEMDDGITEQEALEKFFGPASPFGPLMKKEFLARSLSQTPASALRSLFDDLFNREPAPSVYSRFPLEEVGDRLINPKSDLLLSHIELTQAGGLRRYEFPSLSEAADRYYQALDRAKSFQSEFARIKRILTDRIKKQETMKRALESDLARFEDPERLKRYGDLLLANLATARVENRVAKVIDYYDADQPVIEIEIGESNTLQQAASNYFNRYRKARRALAALRPRAEETGRLLESLTELLRSLEEEPTLHRLDEVRGDASRLLKIKMGGQAEKDSTGKSQRKGEKKTGRWFLSSDGYEIGVGRNDRDNDSLTFRMARPQDIWMHAADYPGSHIIVRNPRREEIPQRTIIEAAEIAAFYSQAREQPRVAVHYTQKKFVSKPPKSKPGLVRLSSFKTALVGARCDLEKIDR